MFALLSVLRGRWFNLETLRYFSSKYFSSHKPLSDSKLHDSGDHNYFKMIFSDPNIV